MINLLGEQDANGEADYSSLSDLLSIPNVYVELYAKSQVRPFSQNGSCNDRRLFQGRTFKAKRRIATLPCNSGKSLKVI